MKAMYVPANRHEFHDETMFMENTDFFVKINGMPVTVYKIRCSAMPFNRMFQYDQRPISQTEILGCVNFENNGEVVVEVESVKDFSVATVRPCSKNMRSVK